MSGTHANMHVDHQAWKSEDDLWRDEIAIWEGEARRALAELPLLERAMNAHIAALEKHAAAIRLYEHEFLKHEHSVAAYERRIVPLRLISGTKAHAEEAEQHGAVRAAHDTMMREHHAFLAKWNRLFSALSPNIESTS
jgi:hypothetical protein